MNLIESIASLDAYVSQAATRFSDLDKDQLDLYDLSFAKAELSAARALAARAAGDNAPLIQTAADQMAAIALESAISRLRRRGHADLPDVELSGYFSHDSVTTLGRRFLEEGIPEDPLVEEQRIVRDTFHAFANEVVAPRAEEIHRQNLIIPDEILNPLRDMGCFGLSVPERFGGLKPDDREDSIGMVVVTEELSRGSLGAAGSLITRPEIMARAVMEGGTAEQQQRWLPKIAAGDPLCAISVTEPNTGSDVANVALRAKRTEGGWLLSGGKTWCTFAGKAEMILVLARTDAEIQPPHKGLSLFVVEKPTTDEHEFAVTQASGGSLSGRSIPTLGYRGMHSFEMFYDDFFVPDANLIGEQAGEGRGFYFTMRGFMGGRLQTAARANGLMRAAFESAARYARERQVFSQAVADYPVTLEKFARMGALITASKALTMEVAKLMDAGEGATEASLVKLFACRSAEWVTREALQIFGGMGYAEETDVSRYFADARVLSIFEGAEETLAIRVVGKALMDGP